MLNLHRGQLTVFNNGVAFLCLIYKQTKIHKVPPSYQYEIPKVLLHKKAGSFHYKSLFEKFDGYLFYLPFYIHPSIDVEMD